MNEIYRLLSLFPFNKVGIRIWVQTYKNIVTITILWR